MSPTYHIIIHYMVIFNYFYWCSSPHKYCTMYFIFFYRYFYNHNHKLLLLSYIRYIITYKYIIITLQSISISSYESPYPQARAPPPNLWPRQFLGLKPFGFVLQTISSLVCIIIPSLFCSFTPTFIVSNSMLLPSPLLS